MVLHVAVIGDSAMWGQGVARGKTFYSLAAAGIAGIRSEDVGTVLVAARSGAKINAVTEDETYIAVLPSGATIQVPGGDHLGFWNTFPAVFDPIDEEVYVFLERGDESPAAKLYGEIPAAFPTTRGQIRYLFSAEDGEKIGLVVLNGGANDVNFEQILDPTSSLDEDEIDALIHQSLYEPTITMIGEARQKFPNAVIILTGYFPAFTTRSDRNAIKALFYHLRETPGWEIAYNEAVENSPNPLLPGILELIGFAKDLDPLVNSSIVRSEQASARGLYWLWRAARHVQSTDPAFLFVHPAFQPENAAFADGTPFHWEQYDVANDDMLDVRLDALRRQSRLGLLGDFEALAFACTRATSLAPGEPHGSAYFDRAALDRVIGQADGPKGLVDFAKTIKGDIIYFTDALVLGGLLYPEIARLKLAEIASFLHPNEAGAARYADRILYRYRQYHKWSVRGDIEALAGPVQATAWSIRNQMRRYGFEPAAGLRLLRDQIDIDSVALGIEGLVPWYPSIPSIPHLAEFKLTLSASHSFDFTVGEQKSDGNTAIMRTFDTFGQLTLGQIDQLTLEQISPSGAPTLNLTGISLTLNGRQAFTAERSSATVAGSVLRFAFPLPVT